MTGHVLYHLPTRFFVAVLKFLGSELFKKNRALTIGLTATLSGNRRVRKHAWKGEQVTEKKEEFDNWDSERFDRLYRKFVFVRGV
jgi:hypothetical protein